MSATVFEKKGKVLTVKPNGRLDAATSPALEAELQLYIVDAQSIIMDFTGVEYISSAGMRVLLATEQRLEESGGDMRLIHVNEHILEIFDLVGFRDIIMVEES